MNHHNQRVVAADARPAGKPGECFYCWKSVGEMHEFDCVIPQKKVRVRFSIDYEVSVPFSWNKRNIEFHRNESSWCQLNGWREILNVRRQTGCCGGKFEVLPAPAAQWGGDCRAEYHADPDHDHCQQPAPQRQDDKT